MTITPGGFNNLIRVWQSGRAVPGQQEPPQRERVRWLLKGLREQRSLRNSLTTLSDGGLVRSVRLARLEAALLISDGPTSARRLAQVARLIDAKEVQQLTQILNESYDRTRSAFRIESLAAGYVLLTRASLAPWLSRLHDRKARMQLSGPMHETLTIIAYQQPVTRADVEAIRGVQSAEMIRQLMDRGLVRVGGEEESLGRPFLYETTRQFLSLFGLRRLEDLPDYGTLRRLRKLRGIADNQDENEDAADDSEAA